MNLTRSAARLRALAFFVVPAIAVACTTASIVSAQTGTTNVPAQKAATNAKKIGFRTGDWKTIHAASTEQAEQEAATLKKIGCEVTTENHGNHIDVKFRCAEWKSMKVATDQLVNQWSAWCANKGMETVVFDPPANTQKPTVKFRLVEPKHVHLHDAQQAEQIINTLQLIGCEVKTNNHGDHMDAIFQCPQWITMELQSEDSAHSWQAWLKASGFETQHTHVK